MDTCKSCNEPVSGNYCQHCGSAVCLEKIDKKYFSSEIRDLIGAESNTISSFIKLLYSPGVCTLEFINQDRSKYVRPIVYLIFTSMIYTIVYNIFGSGADVIDTSEYSTFDYVTDYLVDLIFIQNAGYSNLIINLILAFFLKRVFKKYGFNIYEILVLLCFISGTGNLVFSVFKIISYFLPADMAAILDGRVNMLIGAYTIWGVGSFFDKKKAGSYIKVIVSYILVFIFLFLILLAAVILLTAALES